MCDKTPKTDDDIRERLEKAEEGWSRAQYELGCAYYWGHVVERVFKKARAWFEKAYGEHKNHNAKRALYWNLFDGDVPLLEAAEQGDVQAQYCMASHLEHKRFGMDERDYPELLGLLRRAAEAGFEESQRQLARYLYDGTFGETDYD